MAGNDESPITDEEHGRWYTPAEALIALEPVSPGNAAVLLQDAARTEQIKTSAGSVFCEPKGRTGYPIGGPVIMPAFYWAHLSGHGAGFWETGLIRFWFGITRHFPTPTTLRCTDVRFCREDVDKAKPPVPRQRLAEALLKRARPQEPPAVAAPATKHAGGAPLKPFWDRLWADIGAQLYSGDLKPSKQSDIEQAMLTWATNNNEELSEQSARSRARLLWKAIKDKN